MTVSERNDLIASQINHILNDKSRDLYERSLFDNEEYSDSDSDIDLFAEKNKEFQFKLDQFYLKNKNFQIDDRVNNIPLELYPQLGHPTKLRWCGPDTNCLAQEKSKVELTQLKAGAGEGSSLLAIINFYEKEFEKWRPKRDGSLAVFCKVIKHLEIELITLTGEECRRTFIEEHPEVYSKCEDRKIQKLLGLTTRNELLRFQEKHANYYSACVILELNRRIEELNLREFVKKMLSSDRPTELSLDEMVEDYKTRDLSEEEELFISRKYINLTRIPASISRSSGLKLLYLYDMETPVIPGWIGTLSQLEGVTIRDGKLKIIPERISQLSNLQYLDLSHNELEEIPECIGALSQLNELNLSYNKLTEIPAFLGQLSSLVDCDLQGNPIETEEIQAKQQVLNGIRDLRI